MEKVYIPIKRCSECPHFKRDTFGGGRHVCRGYEAKTGVDWYEFELCEWRALDSIDKRCPFLK